MRTAFFGTTGFAATVLECLIDSGFAPGLVVSPAPSRSGRGRSLTPSAVAKASHARGLPTLEVADVTDPTVAAGLDEAEADRVVVCAFGQIIPPELLAARPFLNVHPSLVPRWRGAAPIERALLAGDEVTGVSIMEMTERLDDGPVFGSVEVEIAPRETYESLSERLADRAGLLLLSVLEQLSSGKASAAAQDEGCVTYADKIEPSERHLDPESTATQLDRRVRALSGRLGTYLALGDSPQDRLGVTSCHSLEHPPDGVEPPAVGEIAALDGSLLLGCSHGLLSVDEVKPPGGRSMTVADYLRGHEAPSRFI